MTVETRKEGLFFINKNGKEIGPFNLKECSSKPELDINFNPTSTQNAIKYLSDQFKKDPFYAYTWHCGVAMAFFDTMEKNGDNIFDMTSHQIANIAAARFMKQAFDVEIDWKGILDDN